MKFLFFLLVLFNFYPCLAATDYALVDAYAKEMRPLKSVAELETLTKKLTRPFKTDAEKARAILAWIVFNIDYDVYRAAHDSHADVEVKLNIQRDITTGKKYIADAEVKDFFKNKDTTPQTLKTRLGICKDIARLYQKMGEYAKLEVTTISGFICEPSAELDGHMWNAVKIDGVWKYVDPTWAVQEKGSPTVSQGRVFAQMRKREYDQILTQRARWNSPTKYARENRLVGDEWFLTDEEKMIQTHFPLERRWQLQKNRIIFEDFLSQRCHMTLDDFLNTLGSK